MKPIDKPSANGLRQIYDLLNNRITALKNLGEPTEHWGTLIENIILYKLDSKTKNEWEIYCVKRDKSLNVDDSNQDISSSEQTLCLDTFLNFINRQCLINEALEKNSLQNKTLASPAVKNESLLKGTKYQKKSAVYVATKEECLFCKEAHSLSVCSKFTALSEPERVNKAKELKLCMNCLRANHRTFNSKSPYTCKVCHKRHHSLVHLTQPNRDIPQPSNQNEKTGVVSGHSTTNQETILATAIVNIEDLSGRSFECRALLDSGSQSNFIKQSLAFALGLKRSKTNTSIFCINGNQSLVKFIVRAFIKSNQTNYRENIEFLVLKKITSNLPSCSLKVNLNVPPTIQLADEEFFKSRGVEILLGADVFYNVLLDGQIKLGQDLPILQNTELGWIMGGKIPIESGQALTHSKSFLSTITHNDSLDNLLTSFWKIEDVTDKKQKSIEEEECERNYLNNVTRQEDGRYIVSLPFSQDPRQSLGASRPQALKRFYALERRLKQDMKLKESYTDFLNKYLYNDEMELVSSSYETDSVYFLPHHPVVKESSSTTKVRVVFDASSKTSTNKSLNDILMTGPTLQRDIFSILLSFRLDKYVFTADIKQMYRRILIDDAQRDYQRILWREDSSKPIQTFKLKTVTYGTASAPYLAVRTLFKLADDEEKNFPLAAPLLRSDIYVDDILTGDDDLNKLIEVQKQMIQLLASGKFELRKWCANHQLLVDHLPPDHLEANFSLTEVDKGIKALGVIWQPTQDSFTFTILNNEPPIVVTKRSILSDISRLYDPVGFVTPVIITAKLVMQEICSLKNLNWDDPVPEYMVNKWIRYRNNLNKLTNISVHRNVLAENKNIGIQSHGFCDASTRAYGAVLYIRTLLDNGKGVVHLLCSKSRVAPLKTLSLPRLELCGALLLAQLFHKCMATLNNLSIQGIILWTESTIVLHWLNAPPNTWQVFVANRISEIQKLTPKCIWRHVKGTQNPADLISRSVSPEAISKCLLWWRGPEWLASNEQDWPESVWTTSFDLSTDERRKTVSVNVIIEEDDHDIVKLYSDWEKLLRIIALCKRFIHNCRHPRERLIGPLESEDYVQAEYSLIKNIQAKVFESDMKHLRKNRMVSNQLKPLSPFLDDNGIIRVGGRLRHANVDADHKNQILLQKITMLLS